MHQLIHGGLMRAMVPLRLRILKQVQERSSWGPDRIKSFQEERLRRMIAACWEHVPFYRSKWEGHIADPEEIRTIEDLPKLPILTKAELRDHLDDMITTDPSVKHFWARSGGSTGRPTVFRMTHFDQETCWAQMYCGWTWAGWRPGDPFLAVGGESIGAGSGDKRTWKDHVMNRCTTSGSNLTRERAEVLAKSAFFRRVRLIFGYPNAIRELAERLHQIGARPPALRGVICTAEVMRPEVRERISELLGGVTVLDQYGLNDGGLLACEGPEQDGLHLFFHRAVLEVLDDENQQIHDKGVPGRAIATSLTNFAVPFIRYETGDDVHWYSDEPSPSGIAMPRIGPVDGRTGDVIHLPSGRSIPMPGLTLVMRWVPGLLQYQFLQTGPREVTVRLERGEDYAWSEEETLAYLREKIADEIEWTITWAAPELTVNGKLLVIRNDWLRDQGLSRPPVS